MSGVSSVAAVSAGRVQTQVQTAIISKVMQVIKGQQQGVANLVESALENAKEIMSSEPGKGTQVDLLG